jgi:hypothetical protein
VAFIRRTFLIEFRSTRWNIPIFERLARRHTAGCASDRLRPLTRDQQSQYGCSIANISRNRQECFRYGSVLVRQPSSRVLTLWS